MSIMLVLFATLFQHDGDVWKQPQCAQSEAAWSVVSQAAPLPDFESYFAVESSRAQTSHTKSTISSH